MLLSRRHMLDIIAAFVGCRRANINRIGLLPIMKDSPDEMHNEPSQPLLSEAEARYGAFFARLDLAVVLIDPSDGSLVDANTVARNRYGVRTEGFGTRSAGDAVASLEELGSWIALANHQQKTHLSLRYQAQDGTVR